MEKWLPPSQEWFKINFDTTIRDNFSAQAAVCCNYEGKIILMVSQISYSCHPNFGEALATLLAASLAASLNLGNFILEGESQIVILELTRLQYYPRPEENGYYLGYNRLYPSIFPLKS